MELFHSECRRFARLEYRVNIFVEKYGIPVVVVSEMEARNSISNVAEYLAAEIQMSHEPLRRAALRHRHEKFGTPYIYVEHYPARVDGAGTRHEVPMCEAWSLVTFESYEPRESRWGDEVRLRLGSATWKYLSAGWMKVLLKDNAGSKERR